MSVDSYFCFCCLSTQDLKNLFSDTDTKFNYVDIVYELCGVKPSSELKDDTYICEECANKLNAICEFKEQVKETVNVLQLNGLFQLRKIKGELLLTKVINYGNSNDEYIKLLKNKDIDVKVIKVEVKTERPKDTKPLPINTKIKIEPQPKFLPKLVQLKIEDVKDKSLPVKLVNVLPRVLYANVSQNKKEKSLPVKLVKVQPRVYNANVSENKKEKHLPIKLVKVQPREYANLSEQEEANHKFECKECFAVLPNSYTYHRHMNMHFPNVICDVCGKGFAKRVQLKRHLQIHERGPFKCKKCDAVFNKLNTMQGHLKKHNVLPTYKCPFCQLRFATFTRRVNHLVTEHNQPRDRHKCHICPKGFPMSSQLRSHLIHQHNIMRPLQKLICEKCGKAFHHKSDYEAHCSKHTGEYNYHCDICGNKYPRKKSLKVHMVSHLTEKPYSCEHCGKGFSQKHAMTNHVQKQVCLRRIQEINPVFEA